MMRKPLVVAVLTLTALGSLFVGAVDISLHDLFDAHSLGHRVWFELRLPRFLLALGAGALLALSGWLFQTLFRNALMTPYTLGISGGAVLGTGIATVAGLGTLAAVWMPLSGFAGALASVALLLMLARRLRRRGSMALLLLGIALSFFFSAALMALFAVASQMQSYTSLRYTMGSLAVSGYTAPVGVLAAAIGLAAMLWRCRGELLLMGIGEETAAARGVDPVRLSRFLLAAASLAIGIQVAATGPIGFVGLVVPHIVRMLYRRANDRLIVPVALFGALFLAACDTLSRALSQTGDIPIGIVTAFVGGPFFIYLILKGERT